MADPYLDREKFIAFMAVHPPVFSGAVSLEIDPEAEDRVITADYNVVLTIATSRGPRRLTLDAPILITHLFPRGTYLFTAQEMAEKADADDLDEAYVQCVEQQLSQLCVEVRWYITDGNQPIGFNKVRDESHLRAIQSRLLVTGVMPVHLGTRYSGNPYVALTDDFVELGTFWEQKTYSEAWKGCWNSGIQFKIYT